jgi:hypothetical protein
MNNYNYVYFYQMEKTQSIMSIGSKIFIFDFQVKEFKEKKSIRLVLFSTLKNFALPETMTIMVNGNAFYLDEFYKIDRNCYTGLYGVIIDLPSNTEICTNDIYIKSYSVNGKSQKFSKGVRLILDEHQKNTRALDFLRGLNQDFIIYPQVRSKYWQCKCGEINFQSNAPCENCDAKYSSIESILSHGIVHYSFEHVLNKKEMEFDFSTDYQENVRRYFDEYFGNHFDFSNFMLYIDELGYKIKFESMKQKKMDEDLLLRKKTRRSRLVTFFSILVILFLVIMYLIFPNATMYGWGNAMLTVGAYEYSTDIFGQISSYKDSSQKKNESKYRHARVLLKKGYYLDASTILESIIVYKDARQIIKEASFRYAEELYSKSDYKNALVFFQKADGYSNSEQKANDIILRISVELYGKKNYSEAASGFKSIIDKVSDAERWYYLTLDEHLKSINFSMRENQYLYGAWNSEVYEGLSKYKFESTILNRLLSDRYWYITLLGTWKTNNGKHYFRMSQDRKLTFNIPTRKFSQIKMYEDKIFVKNSNESEWKPLFLILFTTSDNITLYNYYDKKYYYMKLAR